MNDNSTTKSSTGPARNAGEFVVTDTSELYRVLSSDRRRITLGVLVSSVTPLALRELARIVADREEGNGPVAEEIDPVALELHHNHLPRMDEAGLIHYDSESNQVDDINGALTEQILEASIW